MRFSKIASFSALVGIAAAAPYYPFPLKDGFPNPSPAQLKKIEILAGGALPNGGLPPTLTDAATVTLQLIALNEIFEVAFFNDLLHNVTHNVAGYTEHPDKYDRAYVIEALTAIVNQEKLHYLGVNAALANAGKTTIAPCKYNFPVNNFLGAIKLANTFTDVVLGVLPQAQTVWASDGGDELGLVSLFGSVIAQEAEQNGYYRVVQKKVPSAAPFLTGEGPAFAFTFLQGVIVPGSCPGVELVGKSVPTFKSLTVLSKPTNKNETVVYSVPGKVSKSSNSVVYLSGQNLPLSVPISHVSYKYGVSTFEAELPFQATEGFAKGLTIAAVVDTGFEVTYDSASLVATHTIYGPGIIEID